MTQAAGVFEEQVATAPSLCVTHSMKGDDEDMRNDAIIPIGATPPAAWKGNLAKAVLRGLRRSLRPISRMMQTMLMRQQLISADFSRVAGQKIRNLNSSSTGDFAEFLCNL